MAVSQIQLTESALNQKKTELENYNTQLRKEIDDMNNIEKALIGMWTGDASKEFDSVYQKDSAAFGNFADTVTKYAGAIETILKAYANAEQANVSTAKTRSSR